MENVINAAEFFTYLGWTMFTAGLLCCLKRRLFKRGVLCMLGGNIFLFIAIVYPKQAAWLFIFRSHYELGTAAYAALGATAGLVLSALVYALWERFFPPKALLESAASAADEEQSTTADQEQASSSASTAPAPAPAPAADAATAAPAAGGQAGSFKLNISKSPV
ncbi:MAG: hypothetical protein IJ228_13930 [Succinivibrio sp.]|nr:hypothetical protein [Succinivibrio sp.]